MTKVNLGMHPFESIIFDLDGVITKTALVHSSAWKKVFDEYLRTRALRFSEPFAEFTHEHDYLTYVDGKPRYEGVRSFLRSRKIDIEYGKPEDDGALETICGIGNRKNDAFNQILQQDGVEVYQSTVALMRTLKKDGVRVGVASSSKNCEAVLTAAGLLDLIEVRIDGVVSVEMGLKGKPDPDIFTTACSKLGSSPASSIVVEDAVSGIQAARNGGFGLVLGLARENNSKNLKASGADIVVTDLEEISVDQLDQWFLAKPSAHK